MELQSYYTESEANIDNKRKCPIRPNRNLQEFKHLFFTITMPVISVSDKTMENAMSLLNGYVYIEGR